MSTPAANKPAKKRFYPIFILISVLPLFIMLTLNAVATLPAFAVGIFTMRQEGGSFTNATELLTSPEAQNALTIGFICYALASIVIFFIWYKKVFLKHQIVIDNKTAFNVKSVVLAVLLIIGTSSVINLGLDALSALAPEVMDSYNETLSSAGLGSNFLTTLIYGCMFGPIAEELMFRAVTQGYLRRSGLNAVAVVFIQAILFGIAHMNPVQSTYATLFGLSLGLLRHKYGNIRISCLAHIVFNVFGTFVYSALSSLELPSAFYYTFYAVLSVIGIVAAVFIFKEPVKDIDLYKTPAATPAPSQEPAKV